MDVPQACVLNLGSKPGLGNHTAPCGNWWKLSVISVFFPCT